MHPDGGKRGWMILGEDSTQQGTTKGCLELGYKAQVFSVNVQWIIYTVDTVNHSFKTQLKWNCFT